MANATTGLCWQSNTEVILPRGAQLESGSSATRYVAEHHSNRVLGRCVWNAGVRFGTRGVTRGAGEEARVRVYFSMV